MEEALGRYGAHTDPGSQFTAEEFTAVLETLGNSHSITIVAHMFNPYVPAVHMNLRYLRTSRAWFGGGSSQPDSSRPGGTPFLHEGELYLPTQDCRESYGRALSLLHITTLTPEHFACSVVRHITPDGLHPGFPDGLHTISACNDVTLLDVKRIDRSPQRLWINWQRRLHRLLGMR